MTRATVAAQSNDSRLPNQTGSMYFSNVIIISYGRRHTGCTIKPHRSTSTSLPLSNCRPHIWNPFGTSRRTISLVFLGHSLTWMFLPLVVVKTMLVPKPPASGLICCTTTMASSTPSSHGGGQHSPDLELPQECAVPWRLCNSRWSTCHPVRAVIDAISP